MNRRRFLNTSAMAAAGGSILPGGILRAANGPNNRLDIAPIGG